MRKTAFLVFCGRINIDPSDIHPDSKDYQFFAREHDADQIAAKLVEAWKQQPPAYPPPAFLSNALEGERAMEWRDDPGVGRSLAVPARNHRHIRLGSSQSFSMYKLKSPQKQRKQPKEKKAVPDVQPGRGALFLGALFKRLDRSRELSPHPGINEEPYLQMTSLPTGSNLEASSSQDAILLDIIATEKEVSTAVANVKDVEQFHLTTKVATAMDHAESMLNTIDPLVAPLGALNVFNLVVDAIAQVHPYAQIALSIFKCASQMILDQIYLDTAVRELLSKVSQVYAFIAEREDLTLVPTMQAVLEKSSHQVLDCADFIAHYSETKSFWIRAGGIVLGDTNDAVQGYCGAIDSLMQQFRDAVFRDVAIFTCRAAEDSSLGGLEYARGVGRNTLK
ncbi:uncharacterized protein FIBRA_06516 [Fibroporia radiculosa]|uniref:Uncharacterized protein n=1 Tax=Fibroporia radiculosa TaxID=599839 RepID=J4H443_9APHY|nr:uncharacterized protein FIBRA_06516 [Fibroporia radiculosa]CCM04344.1 predicted protein [Fibroporia radiculosa]